MQFQLDGRIIKLRILTSGLTCQALLALNTAEGTGLLLIDSAAFLSIDGIKYDMPMFRRKTIFHMIYPCHSFSHLRKMHWIFLCSSMYHYQPWSFLMGGYVAEFISKRVHD